MKIGTKRHARRLPQVLGTLLMLVAFAAPALRPAPTSAARADEAEPLDLAAMVLTPDDLEAEGLEGYGVALGGSRSPETVAATFAFPRGAADDEARALFADAGLVQAYELELARWPEAGDTPLASVASTIHEYADEDGAAEAFDALTDWGDVDTAEEVDGDETIGDASAVFSRRGTTAEPFHALELTFRSGHLTAMVRLVDYTGDEPAVADIERLATRLLERIDSRLDEREGGLSELAIRFAGEGVLPMWDYYYAADGEVWRSARETAEDAAEAEETMADSGLTDEYDIGQQIVTNGTREQDTYLYSWVQQFVDEDAASARLNRELDRQAENEDFDDLEELDGLAEYGDESVAYRQTLHWESNDVDLVYQTYVLRAGSQLAYVQLIAPEASPVTALEDLAAAQAACLEAGACDEPAALPEDLAVMVETVAAGSTEPVPFAPTIDALLPDEQTWTGPNYGVELTYSPQTWELLPEMSDATTDRAVLFERHLATMLTISGYAGDHDADACVADLTAGFADEEARGEVRPITDDAGEPIAGGDAEVAYAAYGLLNQDTDLGSTFAYFECRSFADGEAMLMVFHVGPLDEYEERAAARDALLDGLVLPGD